jgi:hypothetical protein
MERINKIVHDISCTMGARISLISYMSLVDHIIIAYIACVPLKALLKIPHFEHHNSEDFKRPQRTVRNP